MANIHTSLKALAPCKFSDVPAKPEQLDPYLADLFSHVQTVVESVPLTEPDPTHRPRSHTTGSMTANNAAEMHVSSARGPAPAPEYAALQREWGKAIKLSAKENPLGISVYKLGSKDGKGAWFARRSVHEGLGFTRFKQAFEREFPTSLAVQGKPGEGNIRGIGAETRVEEIAAPNRGKIEVYRLSAQFPGPTAPRDFVTMLVTSSKAIKSHSADDLAPRHYMIISKPCDHPDTQPRNGFTRGQYESVEFIREIHRKLNHTVSSTDMSHAEQVRRHHGLEDGTHHSHLHVADHGTGPRESSPGVRKRSVTVDAPSSPVVHNESYDPFDPEENPVEWIMVTRSDPGGSVPRFMVERGTPGSICSDAVKFLDWACQSHDDEEASEHHEHRPSGGRRESFARSHAMAGIKEHEEEGLQTIESSPPHTPKTSAVQAPALDGADKEAPILAGHEKAPIPADHENGEVAPQSPPASSPPHSPSSPHFLTTVADAVAAYTPQIVREHFPHFGEVPESKKEPALEKQEEQPVVAKQDERPPVEAVIDDDDASSTISSASFTSADSHLTSEVESPSMSSKSFLEPSESHLVTQHDKDLAKLNERKAATDAKLAKQREKLNSQAGKGSEKDQKDLKKAEEKHQKELKKQEEKYRKEVAKIEQKKKRESQKIEEKKRKEADKDEKSRVTRERDEAKAELAQLRKAQDLLTQQVGELQKENTTLMNRIGKLEGQGTGSPGNGYSRFRSTTVGSEGRQRSSSLVNRKKEMMVSDSHRS